MVIVHILKEDVVDQLCRRLYENGLKLEVCCDEEDILGSATKDMVVL